MEWTISSLVQISDTEYETVTHGSPYNFSVLNSPVIGHLGKMIIIPNWWNQFDETFGGGIGTCEATLLRSVINIGSIIS